MHHARFRIQDLKLRGRGDICTERAGGEASDGLGRVQHPGYSEVAQLHVTWTEASACDPSASRSFMLLYGNPSKNHQSRTHPNLYLHLGASPAKPRPPSKIPDSNAPNPKLSAAPLDMRKMFCVFRSRCKTWLLKQPLHGSWGSASQNSVALQWASYLLAPTSASGDLG